MWARLAYYQNSFPFRLFPLSPPVRAVCREQRRTWDINLHVFIHRPHRPTGRKNTGPSLKPARRNNHNVSLEKKTWSISRCSPLCLSQLNFNWMCYSCDESHAFRSEPQNTDLQCDAYSRRVVWWVRPSISRGGSLNRFLGLLCCWKGQKIWRKICMWITVLCRSND